MWGCLISYSEQLGLACTLISIIKFITLMKYCAFFVNVGTLLCSHPLLCTQACLVRLSSDFSTKHTHKFYNQHVGFYSVWPDHLNMQLWCVEPMVATSKHNMPLGYHKPSGEGVLTIKESLMDVAS